jgi:hypothetical protein
MKKKPKGLKKTNKRPAGLKLRKTVRGKEISLFTIQINTKVLKEGSKKFDALFEAPAEEKPAEEAAPAEEKAPEKAPKDEKQAEEKPTEEKPKEEKKE